MKTKNPLQVGAAFQNKRAGARHQRRALAKIMSQEGKMSSGFERRGANVPGKVQSRPLVGLMEAMASTPVHEGVMLQAQAKSMGYTGNTCSNCGSAQMKVSGHCEVCEACGSTTGCS